jgi:hexosaminidase
MKTYLYLKLLIIILLTGCGPEIDKIIKPSIIPKPLSQKIGNAYFIFDNDVAIVSKPKLQEVSNYFALYLKENYNFKFSNNNSAKKISFKIDDFVKNEEGYELKVEKIRLQFLVTELSLKENKESIINHGHLLMNLL